MKKLLVYYNALSKEDRLTFLRKARISDGYLRKACCVFEKMKPERCVLIEKASNGAVTRKDLREDWAEIWPELR